MFDAEPSNIALYGVKYTQYRTELEKIKTVHQTVFQTGFEL